MCEVELIHLQPRIVETMHSKKKLILNVKKFKIFKIKFYHNGRHNLLTHLYKQV